MQSGHITQLKYRDENSLLTYLGELESYFCEREPDVGAFIQSIFAELLVKWE